MLSLANLDRAINSMLYSKDEAQLWSRILAYLWLIFDSKVQKSRFFFALFDIVYSGVHPPPHHNPKKTVFQRVKFENCGLRYKFIIIIILFYYYYFFMDSSKFKTQINSFQTAYLSVQ